MIYFPDSLAFRSIVFLLPLLLGWNAFSQEQILDLIRRENDRNRDGTIEKSEAQGLLKRNFDRVDTNQDGQLDAAEQKALAERLSGALKKNGSDAARNLLNRFVVPKDVLLKKDIPYRTGNDAWKLDLVMPKEKGTAPRPAIVFVHGGGWRAGDKGTGIWRTYPIEFAKKGYVCISINYRLSQDSPFPACVEDCKCAVRWLRAHAKEYNVDRDRIGAFGNSAGAHLVSMLGLVGPDEKLEGDGPYQDQSSLVQAVVPAATPADFTVWAKDNLGRKGRLLAGDPKSLDERARRASPVTYAHKNAPPFLIFHGTADRVVPVDQGRRLKDALVKAGAPDVTLKIYEGAGHGVFRQHEKETLPLVVEFFAKHLKK